MILLVLFLLAAATGARAATCTCESVGDVYHVTELANATTRAGGGLGATPVGSHADVRDLSVGSNVSLTPLTNGTSFMFSNDPDKWPDTTGLFAKPLFGTFACQCVDSPRATNVRYIVSATQTDPLGKSVRKCLGTGAMNATCAVLERMGIMTCLNMWSSGMSGLADAVAVDTNVVASTARQVGLAQAGDCAATLSYVGALDAVAVQDVGGQGPPG